jgi:rhodanese-related sulfurtransferase
MDNCKKALSVLPIRSLTIYAAEVLTSVTTDALVVTGCLASSHDVPSSCVLVVFCRRGSSSSWSCFALSSRGFCVVVGSCSVFVVVGDGGMSAMCSPSAFAPPTMLRLRTGFHPSQVCSPIASLHIC